MTSFGYWDYYDDSFDWDDSKESLVPDLQYSREKLEQAGMSATMAQRCVDSGFVYEKFSNHIIDRYYGGALLSADFRTRFSLPEFVNLEMKPKSGIQVLRVGSWEELRRTVDAFAAGYRRRLLFRGQTETYLVQRAIHNPYLTINGLGEISLIPSLWRVMLQKRQNSFLNFRSLNPFEWEHILNSAFDLSDIHRRMRAIAGENLAYYNLFDFEECDDPVLKEYAKCQLDLKMGANFNLSDLLATLLQHYGLYSPVLDLTSSLDVAIFFATHKLKRYADRCAYELVGTNSSKSVIYVLGEMSREMQIYESNERIIQKLLPTRPKRQECVIARSAPYAINLPADFLLGVIVLDFDYTESGSSLTADYLFPSEKDDAFLRALKTSPFARKHLTDFTNWTKHS